MIKGTGDVRYLALIDRHPGAYGVVFPDLPGCMAVGDTLDQAIMKASAALTDWISTVEGNGGTAPPASPAEALRCDPEVANALADGVCLLAVQAELSQAAQAIPLHDRFAALRAAYPLPLATGKPADKAFFDEMSGELP